MHMRLLMIYAFVATHASPCIASLPLDTVDLLRSNASSLDQLTIRWNRSRHSQLADEELLPIVAPNSTEKDRTFFRTSSGSYTRDGSRVHIVYKFDAPQLAMSNNSDSTLGDPEEWIWEVFSDGSLVYNGNRRAKSDTPPNLIIESVLDEANPAFTDGIVGTEPLVTCLSFAGFVVPNHLRDFQVPVFRSIAVDLQERGSQVASQSTEDGYVLSAVYGGNLIELHLSRNHAYAPIRYVRKSVDGQRILEATMTDFARVPQQSNVWLPKVCRAVYFQYRSRPERPTNHPLFEEEYTLSATVPVSLEGAFVDELVEKYNVPGAFISDGTLESAEENEYGQISYEVPARKQDLDEVVRRAIEQDAFEPSTRPIRRWWLLFANSVVVLLIVGFTVLRWVRNRKYPR